MSPGRSPALAPGPPSSTSATITPASVDRLSASASVAVIVCVVTPISPRRTRPVLRICSKTLRTMLLGAAKPMPSLPPDCE